MQILDAADGPLTRAELAVLWPQLGNRPERDNLELWEAVTEVHCPWRCIPAAPASALCGTSRHTVYD